MWKYSKYTMRQELQSHCIFSSKACLNLENSVVTGRISWWSKRHENLEHMQVYGCNLRCLLTLSLTWRHCIHKYIALLYMYIWLFTGTFLCLIHRIYMKSSLTLPQGHELLFPISYPSKKLAISGNLSNSAKKNR